MKHIIIICLLLLPLKLFACIGSDNKPSLIIYGFDRTDNSIRLIFPHSYKNEFFDGSTAHLSSEDSRLATIPLKTVEIDIDKDNLVDMYERFGHSHYATFQIHKTMLDNFKLTLSYKLDKNVMCLTLFDYTFDELLEFHNKSLDSDAKDARNN